jgi:hypothetical protein
MAQNGSKATFQLFSQCPEQRRQRTFPASAERVFVTQGDRRSNSPGASIDRLKADVPALGAPANFLVIGSLAKELREKI